MKVLRNPYKARKARVITWLLIWKYTPWINRLINRDVARKIGEILRDDWIIIGRPMNVRINGKIRCIYFNLAKERWFLMGDPIQANYLPCLVCLLPVTKYDCVCHRQHPPNAMFITRPIKQVMIGRRLKYCEFTSVPLVSLA